MSFSFSGYTKIDVGWGFAPDPTALPRPIAGFKGAALRQEGNEGEGKEGRTGDGKGEEGEVGDG